jgi:hypothetical protein
MKKCVKVVISKNYSEMHGQQNTQKKNKEAYNTTISSEHVSLTATVESGAEIKKTRHLEEDNVPTS